MQVVSMDITKVKKLLKNHDELMTKADEFRKEAAACKAEAIASCPHCITESHSEYCDGSYLDRASTTTYTKCAICGIQLDAETETHSWYG